VFCGRVGWLSGWCTVVEIGCRVCALAVVFVWFGTCCVLPRLGEIICDPTCLFYIGMHSQVSLRRELMCLAATPVSWLRRRVNLQVQDFHTLDRVIWFTEREAETRM
jgi:hypothetical protein